MSADTLTVSQGFVHLRTLPNGITIWKREWREHGLEVWRAFTAAGQACGSLSLTGRKGSMNTGWVLRTQTQGPGWRDYGAVQSPRGLATITTYTEFHDYLKELPT